jgi:hypothetical protein
MRLQSLSAVMSSVKQKHRRNAHLVGPRNEREAHFVLLIARLLSRNHERRKRPWWTSGFHRMIDVEGRDLHVLCDRIEPKVQVADVAAIGVVRVWETGIGMVMDFGPTGRTTPRHGDLPAGEPSQIDERSKGEFYDGQTTDFGTKVTD